MPPLRGMEWLREPDCMRLLAESKLPGMPRWPCALTLQNTLAGTCNVSALHGCVVCSQATKPKGLELWLNRCIIVTFTVGGVLAGVGSVRNIIVHAKDYHVL